MSIINQMLKDLEKREKVSLDPDITLSGLSSTETSDESTIKKIHIGIGIFLVISLIFLTKFFSNKSEAPSNHLTMTWQATAVSNDSIPDGNPYIAVPASANLSNITLETHNNVTEIKFFLTNNIQYMLATNKQHNDLVLTLEHTKLDSDLHAIDYLKSGIQGMQMTSNKEGDLIVTFNLQPGIEVSYLDMMPDEKTPTLLLKLSNNPPALKQILIFQLKKRMNLMRN